MHFDSPVTAIRAANQLSDFLAVWSSIYLPRKTVCRFFPKNLDCNPRYLVTKPIVTDTTARTIIVPIHTAGKV